MSARCRWWRRCASGTAWITTTSSASCSRPPTTSTPRSPRLGVRRIGFGDVPLICARELDIVTGTPRLHPSADAPDDRAQPRRAPPRVPRGRGQPPRRPSGLVATHRAAVVGTGLIGGSIGLALRRKGLARQRDRTGMTSTAARALELGALDAIGGDPTAEITFLATPVQAVAERGAARVGGRSGDRDRRGQRQGLDRGGCR